MAAERKRTIIIVGENHSRQDITKLKLLDLPASLDDVVLFIEGTESKTYTTNKGEKTAIPISTTLPSVIEGIFQMLTFLAIFKSYGNGKMPGYNMPPSRAISIVGEMYDINLSNEEVVADPLRAFDAIKRKLIEVCSGITGNDYGIIAYVNSDAFSYDILTPEFAENPFFKASFKLVDEAIVANIHQHHSSSPPNVAFIIITGGLHVANLLSILQPSPNYRVVQFEGLTGMEGGRRTRYKKKRNIKSKRRSNRLK